MDKIKDITSGELEEIASEKGFSPTIIAKDYHIVLLLYLMKNLEGAYFKGGTALQKIFLNHARMSEDIDFTVTSEIEHKIKEITEKIEETGLFGKITRDKSVEGFTRLVVRYKDQFGNEGEIFIDLNKRGKLLLKTENHEIKHFYKNALPSFEMNTLAVEEMVAEKIAASISRNAPRDHFDIYMIIKAKMPMNLEMAKKKCEGSNNEFSIIKMFNKAQKLKNRWDVDLIPLLAEETSFQEVMTTLAKHFKLKEEKEKKKASANI